MAQPFGATEEYDFWWLVKWVRSGSCELMSLVRKKGDSSCDKLEDTFILTSLYFPPQQSILYALKLRTSQTSGSKTDAADSKTLTIAGSSQAFDVESDGKQSSCYTPAIV
jgi:hypothetical protein